MVREGRATAKEFLELLEKIGREADGRIRLVVDNAGIPTVQAVRAWTAAREAEFEIHRQPAYAPQGHPVEQLRALEKRQVRGGS